jgi:hypothetical protein
MDTWINEGLSTAAEYIYGGDPCNRVIYYNNDSEKSIRRGNNFFVWEGGTGGTDSLADYATAYLFFQWIRLHAATGQGIYKEIIANAVLGYTDYRAVSKAAKKFMPDLGLHGDNDWETLIRSWYLANFLNQSTGVYGYKGQIPSITPWDFSGTNTTTLFPGENIVRTLSGSYTPSGEIGAHIKYMGVSSSGASDTDSPYTGEVLLTFNANTSIDGPQETVVLPGIVPPESAADAQVLSAARNAVDHTPLPDVYPVDARTFLEKYKRENSE